MDSNEQLQRQLDFHKKKKGITIEACFICIGGISGAIYCSGMSRGPEQVGGAEGGI